MIQFVLENKEWLFSGIGVAILITAATAIYRKFFSKKKSELPTEQTPQIVIHLSPNKEIEKPNENSLVPIERISAITFEHIKKAIKDAPPLQRESVKKSFLGIKVEWDSVLKGASKDDEGIVSLRLSPGIGIGDMLCTIHCKVAFDDYRELGILPEGARIRIQGEIAEADTYDVELVNVRLYFLENK